MSTLSMDELTKAQDYSRAIQCSNLSYLPKIDVKKYVDLAKQDWNSRAELDASSYVCASSKASEDNIQASGLGDVEREFLPRIQSYKHATILEIGCGFGRMSQFISKECNKLYSVDISSKLLEIARKRLSQEQYSHIDFLETDGLTIPDNVPDNSIDFAFEYIVFQHIVSPVVISYIRSIYKKLKPRGILIAHGRDIDTGIDEITSGNTWHGSRFGSTVIAEAIHDTSFKIINEEGIGTERYWVTLQKG